MGSAFSLFGRGTYYASYAKKLEILQAETDKLKVCDAVVMVALKARTALTAQASAWTLMHAAHVKCYANSRRAHS